MAAACVVHAAWCPVLYEAAVAAGSVHPRDTSEEPRIVIVGQQISCGCLVGSEASVGFWHDEMCTL